MLRHAAAILAGAVLIAGGQLYAKEHLRVDGRYLKDPHGDKVILRGANAMTKYWDANGAKALPQLAATRANAVRLFWTINPDVPLASLDASIQRARDLGMVPMLSVWDATGKWDLLRFSVNWWFRPEVLAIVKKHHDYLLINIANEAGDRNVGKQDFEDTYRGIITRFRDAGISAPLVIDAANWGRDESYLLERGPALLEHDSERNLIFSWHPWDSDQPASRYRKAMEEAIRLDLCLVVGEFSHIDVFYRRPINWQAIIELAHEHEIGWLFWCWRGAKPDDGHAITTEYTWESFNQWGWEVAFNHPFSIYHTSVRTPWLAPTVAPEDPLPYKRWQALVFSPNARDAGVDMTMGADPDGDNIPNAWEWAFGLSPIEANPQAILRLVYSGTDEVFLRYPQPHLPGTTLWLESSLDLNDWTPVNTSSATNSGDGLRDQPVSKDAVRFYRWHLSVK